MHNRDSENQKPRIISLFSGCGGMDLGFKKAGFEIVYANDIETSVKSTYEHNLGHQIHIGDISKVDKGAIPQGDVIIAGIPCQPFSSAGNRGSMGSADGNLFLEVIETIRGQKDSPKVVIFENVRGFLSSLDPEGKPMVERFRDEMLSEGYETFHQLLNASDFGVPSNRYRVFIVCVHKSVGTSFNFPLPDVMVQKTLIGEVLSTPMPGDEVEEVWDLPPSSTDILPYIPEGGSWKDVPYELLAPRHKRIRDDMKKYRAPNFYRRFSRSEVMGTVTASATPENSGIFHPVENRRYSVREIARFQSFPDDFKFLGDNIPKKYKMIGNAVPPLLAERLAISILEQIFPTSEPIDLLANREHAS